MSKLHFKEVKDIDPLASQSSFSPTKRDAEPRSKYWAGMVWLVWPGILALTGVGGWISYQRVFNHTPNPVAVNFIPVSLGDVETTVTESGTVELGGQQTFKAPREVTIEQVNVKEGELIRKGQPLVMLRDRAIADQIKDNLAESAKYELDLARSQKRVAEVQQKLADAWVDPDLIRNQERIGEVREKVKAAEARFIESQELLNRGFISATDLQTDKDSLDAARAQLRDAQANQQKVQQSYKTKLETIRAELQDAQVNRQKAEVEVQKSVQKLKGLQQQFADRIVAAPIDGLVLKVDVRKGDGVKIESNLLTIGDPKKEVVKLQLSTLNAAKVRINQLAKVSMIGPNSKVFTGRVISLSPQATTLSASSGPSPFESSGGGQAKVDTKVLLDRPSSTLIPGGLVSVEIVTARRRSVVVIPPEAIQRSQALPFVWLKDSQGKSKKQPLQLGLQGLQTIEVTSGLKAGDQLVIPPPDISLTPGTPLTEKAEGQKVGGRGN